MARARAPLLRLDDLDLRLVRGGGVAELAIRSSGPVTAAHPLVLPAFEGWSAVAELRLDLSGVCREELELTADARAEGRPEVPFAAPARVAAGSFRCALTVPLRSLRSLFGEALSIGVSVREAGSTAAPRRIPILGLTLQPFAAPGPSVQSLELGDATDAELYGAPVRRAFDVASPEEGFWKGSGRALLRLVVEWAGHAGEGFALEPALERLGHALRVHGDERDAVAEDVGRRASSEGRTQAELVLDTGHPGLGEVPEEGRDVRLELQGVHALSFAAGWTARLSWQAPCPVRLRDPRPHLRAFQRLSPVGIDFGTSATVAALYQRGYRSLLQLGRPDDSPDATSRAAENPTVLLVEDHERLWAELARGERFPFLVRVLRASHAALAGLGQAPNAVIGELKTLPDRVLGLDESPQLRDRERQRDFLLDEPRVRALLRAYAYVLGRAINRPGQDVFLRYVLTAPAKQDAKAQALVEEEVKAGLLLALPSDIPANELVVEVAATEPEAFAAEVCPELCAHPDLAPLLEKHGELRFVVFDLGGGTLDVACGRFRPPTEAEQADLGANAVIETLQVNGQRDLGGEVLTHELAWVAHQHPSVLPEMEAKDVPMMRPPTVPANHLARRPELWKRSLAARQNKVRVERALRLERVKFGPAEAPQPAPDLALARLDGTEAVVTSYGGDLAPLAGALREHLLARFGEAVKLLDGTLSSAPWPAGAGEGGPVERGIVTLLAGNSSRSAFVAQAVAEHLGLVAPGEPFEPWRPSGGSAPMRGVVLWETPPRTERGATLVGVTPKTAVALGALKIANHEVHLVRASQGFGYFLGDLRGFPPKYTALVPMGAPSGAPDQPGPHLFDFGRWDSKTPLRASREYVAGKMTSSDPRISLVPTGLPPGHVGRLFVAVVSPDEVVVCLDLGERGEPLVSRIDLEKALR